MRAILLAMLLGYLIGLLVARITYPIVEELERRK